MLKPAAIGLLGATRDGVPRKAPRIAADDAARACLRLMKLDPVHIEYPGGHSRCSVRAVCGDESYIVTRRKQPTRAALEAGVLRELHAAGAPVPAVLAFDGEWLIQEDFGCRRLSAALGAEDMRVAGNRVAHAADALLRCQRAAQKAGLAQRVAPIGVKPEWLAGLLSIPGAVARQLELPEPDIGAAIAPEQLTPKHLAFVKWDARPGNALLIDGGGVAWIDWEHCGARDALDDLAWLLCDEYIPDDAALESTLLERFLPLFGQLSGRTPDDAQLYLSRFGTLHTCMRLFLVLKHKGEGAWWSPEACERTDRVGVTAQAARRLCQRGARWSQRMPGGEPLARFFIDAAERLCDRTADAFPTFASAELVNRNTPAAHSAQI